MNPLTKACYILRYLGPRLVCLRAGVYTRRWLGLTRRRFAPRPWDQIALDGITQHDTPTDPEDYARFKRESPPPFLFPLGEPPQVPQYLSPADGARSPGLPERLRLLAGDRCVHFFDSPSPQPIDWYASPFDGGRSDPARIWCDISDYVPEQGDLRTLWEPARAAWAIDLARARARACAGDAAGLFWRWVDSWMDACPPFAGIHWQNGQECAVRAMAIALGFWSLADDPATSPQRWVQLARFAWASGYRIFHDIQYAVSQKNNHAISEASGLLLLSQLFSECRDASAWRATGRRVLTAELRRQIYDDGSYVQHSTNYHRVMLDGAVLGLRLAELADEPLPADLYQRVGRAGEFLYQIIDPATGRAPNCGNNDGACVLPLTECDFGDYRPVIQAVHYLVHRQRLFETGPWDEQLAWLFGPQAVKADQAPAVAHRSSSFRTGGYYTLRRADSWAMIRCHTYRDRPAHCDLLHVDLWWRGQNILCDCGTYRYYLPGRADVERYFKSMAAHNTVEVDGQDPLELVSRYLWLPWPRAGLVNFRSEDACPMFVGEHYAYSRPPWHVVHRRTVEAVDDGLWRVTDDVLGTGVHGLTLRWHIIDSPYVMDRTSNTVRFSPPVGSVTIKVSADSDALRDFTVVRGRDEPDRVQGLVSPSYGRTEPAPVLEVALRGRLPQRIITLVGLERADHSSVRAPADIGQQADVS